MPNEHGRVYLVGAGPGAPDLITLRGALLLTKAEVVAYDRLIHPRLLNLCSPEAERIPVGKAQGGASISQARIHQILLAKALQGKQVMRLKGGDPLVFGRGGEEALFLLEHGIPVEIVPGVSSALAAPGAAGIPLTHRGTASSVAIVTGRQGSHGKPIPWDSLAGAADTLVVLMPVGKLEQIVSELMAQGRSRDTPAALVHWATRGMQRKIYASLGEIALQARKAGIEAPATLIVGPTVEIGLRIEHLLTGSDGPLQQPLRLHA